MQYPRHNFTHNFLNAVETDSIAAWDILVNEVNELILENAKQVEKTVRDSGVTLHKNPSNKDLTEAIHDAIYVNEPLRRNILRMIAHRHKDVYHSANGGPYDKVLVDGQLKADLNINGDLANDGETLNFIFSGAKKILGRAKDRVIAQQEKKRTKSMATENLAAKEKQRNLPVSKNKDQISTNQIIGFSLGAVALISLVAFLIYKSNQTEE